MGPPLKYYTSPKIYDARPTRQGIFILPRYASIRPEIEFVPNDEIDDSEDESEENWELDEDDLDPRISSWGNPKVISSLKSAEVDPTYTPNEFVESFFDTNEDDHADASEVYDVSWDGPTAADYERNIQQEDNRNEASKSSFVMRDLSQQSSSFISSSTSISDTVQTQNLNIKRGRTAGYMGDCTLEDIALDYNAPLCYLMDVLMDWGVPPPIQPSSRLGDLVTGEQAYSIVEAMNSLDMHEVSDRYESSTLYKLAGEYEIPLQDAFEFCMREGYNLPRGVQTVLRVGQAQEMIEALYDGDADDLYDTDFRDGSRSSRDVEDENFIDYQDFSQEDFV